MEAGEPAGETRVCLLSSSDHDLASISTPTFTSIVSELAAVAPPLRLVRGIPIGRVILLQPGDIRLEQVRLEVN